MTVKIPKMKLLMILNYKNSLQYEGYFFLFLITIYINTNMPKLKYDLILLDLDGTVADTDEMIVQSMYQMYDLYRDGKRTPREEIYYFSGPPIRETLKREFPGQDIDFLVKEFVKISWNNYDKYAKLFPHVKEAIVSLQNKGVKFAIVTSKARRSCQHCLEVIGLDDIITFYVTSDDVSHTKPHPEGIFQALEHFSIINRAKVLYIGDNKSDYLTAKNAGVDVALVTWGPRRIDRSLTPEYWIDDFNEVEEIVHE